MRGESRIKQSRGQKNARANRHQPPKISRPSAAHCSLCHSRRFNLVSNACRAAQSEGNCPLRISRRRTKDDPPPSSRELSLRSHSRPTAAICIAPHRGNSDPTHASAPPDHHQPVLPKSPLPPSLARAMPPEAPGPALTGDDCAASARFSAALNLCKGGFEGENLEQGGYWRVCLSFCLFCLHSESS